MSDKKVFWGFGAKDLVYILILGVVCFFGYRAYKDLSAEVLQSNIAFKQLSETLARAQNELVTKAELNVFAKMTGIDLSKIKTDLKKVGADLSAVGQTVATIEGTIQSGQGSDDTTDHDTPDQPQSCKLCDLHNYTASIQAKDVMLGKMPHARVEFDASKDKPWTIVNDKVDVEVTTIVGKSDKENVDVFYHEIALINGSRPDLAGKKFKLKIVSSEFKQTLSGNKEFYWWNPIVDLGIDIDLSLKTEPTFLGGSSLGFSFLSYGDTKNSLDWKFLRLGAGMSYDKNLYLTIQPAQYNMKNLLPFISDMWIGVNCMWDGNWGIGLSISTNL